MNQVCTVKLRQSISRLKLVLGVILADAVDNNALGVGHPRMNLGKLMGMSIQMKIQHEVQVTKVCIPDSYVVDCLIVAGYVRHIVLAAGEVKSPSPV